MQKCLASILSLRIESEAISSFIFALFQEAQKPGIATSSAFVLVEWFSLLMQHLAGTPLWDEFSSHIILGTSHALERCLQPTSRTSVAHSAIVVTRRGLRKLISIDSSRERSLRDTIQILTTKGSQPSPGNALYLGVIAGVSARNPQARSVLESVKAQFFAFYTRELVGSRSSVPTHLASGLHDFFHSYVTLGELEREIMPSVEKGLLRAPEVVLCDLISPLLRSLPIAYDLSMVLYDKLLKPILSSIKSSNAAIRGGAVMAFKTTVERCQDMAIIDKVADEILGPLKTGKLASADHRVLHSEMLAALPLNTAAAEKLSASMATIAGKEGNEVALSAETLTATKAASHLLQHNLDLSKVVVEAFSKGLGDKKPSLRRLWLLRVGEILYSFRERDTTPDNVMKFAEPLVPKLIDTYNEVLANPLPASQNGLIVGSYVICTVSPLLLRASGSPSAKSPLAKLSIHTQSLLTDPKPSFLLNPRIYGKLTAEEDLRWLCRGLIEVAPHLSGLDSRGHIAWAQAIIYLICASSTKAAVRKETGEGLSRIYASLPDLISKAVVGGMWYWIEMLEEGDKDSAALASKTGNQHLHTVLRAICLSTREFRDLLHEPNREQLERQMCSLLTLARPELVPRISWIDLCLHVEVDPGDLARKYETRLLDEVKTRTAIEQKVR